MIVATFSAGVLENKIGRFGLNQAAAGVVVVVTVLLAMLCWQERRGLAKLRSVTFDPQDN